MKKSQITLIIIGFILLALMATNPTIEDHRQAVMNEIKEELSQDSDPNNKWEQVGQAIGMAFGQGIIEKAVTRDNYLIFSITKLSFGNKSKYAGIGILGKVFIKNNEEINSSFNNTSSGMNGSNSNAEDVDYIQVDEIQVLKNTSSGTKEYALEFQKNNPGWRLPGSYEIEKINKINEEMSIIQCGAVWLVDYYGNITPSVINKCDFNVSSIAMDTTSCLILLVRDKN